MAFSRYSRTPLLNLGEFYGTSTAQTTIREAVKSGALKTQELIVKGVERLDTIAGSIYGDSRYWWILACASDIGWALQVPPGTIIKIPDLNDISQLIS